MVKGDYDAQSQRGVELLSAEILSAERELRWSVRYRWGWGFLRNSRLFKAHRTVTKHMGKSNVL